MASIPASVSTVSTDQLVEMVAACAAELAARPASDHPGVCFEQAETLGRAADAIEAAIAGRVAVADRHGEPQRCGYPSATSWLRTSLGMRHSRADDRAVLARQLDRLPQVAKRLAAEQLSFGYASVIAGAVRRLDDAEAEKGEQILLDLVDAGCTVKEVTAAGDRIKQLIAERDGTEPEPEDGRRGERQWWTMTRTGGGRALSKGVFGPELAALIRAKIEPLAKPAGAEDTRDHAQRMADALQMYLADGGTAWDPILIIELTQPIWQPRTARDPGPTQSGLRGRSERSQQAPDDWPAQPGHRWTDPSDRGDVETAGEPPAAGRCDPQKWNDLSDPQKWNDPQETSQQETAGSYEIVAPDTNRPGSDERDLDVVDEPTPGGPGATWELRPPAPSWPVDGTSFTARLPDGTPISLQAARRILLSAGFSALVLGTDGQPLYLGRKVRCATPHQRRALNARYRTCVVTGCDIPAELSQLDHVESWFPDGVTDIDKLVPLCAWHNRYKWDHPNRFTITLRDDGRYRYELVRPGRGP